MKNFIPILNLLLVVCFQINYAYAKKLDNKDIAAVITDIKGNVQVLKKNIIKWVDVTPGYVLFPDDKIRTDTKSYALIILANGSEIKLNKNSNIIIEDFQEKTDELKLKITYGQIRVKKFSVKKTKLVIDTDIATIIASETDFDLKFYTKLIVKVYEGEVEIKNEVGSIRVKSGEQSTTVALQQPGSPQKIIEKDTWQSEIEAPNEKILVITLGAQKKEKIKLKLKKIY